MHIYCRLLVVASITATVASSLRAYPHELSYFNELAGGSKNGWKHLVHSNIDWGQGLVELDRALDGHPDWGPVAIAYSGPISPELLGSRAVPIDFYRRPCPLHGFSHVAISVNILAGCPEGSPWYRTPDWFAPTLEHFFREQQPIDRLDGSIYVYDTRPYLDLYEATHSLSTVSFANGRPDFDPKGLDALTSRNLPTLIDSANIDDLSVSDCCHVLLLHGWSETGLKSPASGDEAFKILTDERVAKAIFGQSPFIVTRHGLRYRRKGATGDGLKPGESHRDQCLSTFAEMQLSLSEPITLESETLALRDILSESIANFTFEQGELSWTAQAYAYYLPPARHWTDRFGNMTSFSDLVREIMKRGYVNQSCAGVHALLAVGTILRADRHFGVLDRTTRIAAQTFVSDAIRDILRNQCDDGSWDFTWTPSLSQVNQTATASASQRMIVTGHILEFLHAQKPALPSKVTVHATEWLLKTLNTARVERTRSSVCPLTHALRATRMSLADSSLSIMLAVPSSSN